MLAHDAIEQSSKRMQELQVRRKFAIKLQIKNMNSVTALAARYCGFDPNAEDDVRKKIWKRAEAIVGRGLGDKEQKAADRVVAEEIARELDMLREIMIPIVKRRDEIETEMDTLASLLPGQHLIAATTGFNVRGLAVIVGEAGNLWNYPDKGRPAKHGPPCLWRRLGLGLGPGHEAHAYSTWAMIGGLTKEDWRAAGYSPRRLAQIIGVVTAPLMFHKNKNKYGAVYDRRRARTLFTHPEWYLDKDGNPKLNKDGEPSSEHAQKDAERVATKALISDLWSEWRRAGNSETERSFA